MEPKKQEDLFLHALQSLRADALSVLYENAVAAVDAAAHDEISGDSLCAVGAPAEDIRYYGEFYRNLREVAARSKDFLFTLFV